MNIQSKYFIVDYIDSVLKMLNLSLNILQLFKPNDVSVFIYKSVVWIYENFIIYN